MPTILSSSVRSDPDPPVLRTVSGWPRHIARRTEQLLMRSGRSLREASVLLVGVSMEARGDERTGIEDREALAAREAPAARETPAAQIIARLRAEEVRVDYYDPLVPTLRVDGEELRSVRIELRGEGPNLGRGESVDVKRYDLVILAALHPGHDYAWVQRCPAVLDCTYSTPGGRRRFLP